MNAIKRLQILGKLFLGSKKVKLGNLKRHTVILVDSLVFKKKYRQGIYKWFGNILKYSTVLINIFG